MKKGIGIFGKQYEFGYKNETHAKGSVVRILFDEMVKLDEDSVDYLCNSYTGLSKRYERGSRPVLEKIVDELKGANAAETVDNIMKFCRGVVVRCNTPSKNFIYGGTEEKVIERATYWCTDVARVACVLFQIAEFPSRIIVTVNSNFAYCGHSVAEVYYDNKWCLTDPNAGLAFRHENGSPASAWEVHNNYEIANKIYYNSDLDSYGNSIFFPPGEQFESIGITNYYVGDMEKYDYTTSGTNEFYQKIMKHSSEKWAGGLRWVHGEELL